MRILIAMLIVVGTGACYSPGLGLCSIECKTDGVTFFGNGDGHVTSIPPGLDCQGGAGTVCVGKFDEGTAVELDVDRNGAPTAFIGWGGGCQGTPQTGPCSVDLASEQAVTVTFEVTRVTFLAIPDGGGTISVTSVPGQTCPPDCTFLFPPTPVSETATAVPNSISLFDRWINGCDVGPLNPSCSFLPVDGQLIVALFEDKPSVTVNADPFVMVTTSGPNGSPLPESCGGSAVGETCTFVYPPGTFVTLGVEYTEPNAAATLQGWSACPDINEEKVTRCDFQILAKQHHVVRPSFIVANPRFQ